MATRTSQTAEYKGRKYRLLWSGDTRYGRRAKLEFFDGTKQFWCDESAITVVANRSHGSYSEPPCRCGNFLDEGDGECMMCGGYWDSKTDLY